MKCEYCGKKLGLFNRITLKKTEHICKGHLAEWGFTTDDLKGRYKWESWHFMVKGRKECEEILNKIEYTQTHTKEKYIDLGMVDEDMESFIVRAAKKDLNTDDLYGGWTISDMRNYDDEGPHYIFEGLDFDCEVKEGDVIFEGKTVGHVDAIPNGETYLKINGGKYRKMIFDGEKMKGYAGETALYLTLKVVYIE